MERLKKYIFNRTNKTTFVKNYFKTIFLKSVDKISVAFTSVNFI